MNGEKEFETPIFNDDGEFNEDILIAIKKAMVPQGNKKEEFDPNQPRDDDGKWSDTGGKGGSGDMGGSSSKSTDSDDDFFDSYVKDAIGEEGYQDYKDELAGKKSLSPKIEINEHELDHFSATAARENPVFSKDDDIGVNTYKSGSYKEVNDYCRGDRDNREFTDAIDYHGVQIQTPSQAVERIDSTMSHFQTDTDTEVYRGIGENTANKLLKTNVVENAGYSSTAISPEVAYGFAKRGDDGYKHVMKFTVPKGTNYLYWNEETELMLPRNLKLKEVSRVEYSRLYVDGKTVSGNAQFGMPKIMIHNMVIV